MTDTASAHHCNHGSRDDWRSGALPGSRYERLYLSKPIQPGLLLKTLDELVLCASGSPTTQDRVSALGLVERESPTVLPEAPVYYDRGSALRRIGGDQSLLWDLMDLFVEDCPKQLNRIRDAQQRGDHTALHSYAHTLKGTIGHFSAARALKAAGHLEETAMGQDPVESRKASRSWKTNSTC